MPAIGDQTMVSRARDRKYQRTGNTSSGRADREFQASWSKPEFVFQSVPVKMKTHVRRWTVSIAAVVLLLIAAFMLLRSPTVRDRMVPSEVDIARLPEPRDTLPNDTPSSGKSSDQFRRDSLVKSTDLDEALPHAPGSKNSSESFVEYNQIPHYVDANDWVKTALPCWAFRGSTPQKFVVEADHHVRTSGKTSASMVAVELDAGWGTLYQFANARDLRGKRVQFSADIRTAVVALRASIFVRADDEKGNAVAFDNMWFNYVGENPTRLNRSLSGDNEWTTEQVVLDIPLESTVVSYGATLEGAGKVWIDNAHLEIVGNDTPITAIVRPATMLQHSAVPLVGRQPPPRNLDFEQAGFNGKCD
jgi:hypothetical protein